MLTGQSISSVDTGASTPENSTYKPFKSAVSALGLDPVWKEAELRQYKLVRVIAKGGYGVVVEAMHMPTGREVAIKHMANFHGHKYTLIKVLRELSLMHYLREVQAQKGVPTLFTGALDAFAPECDT